MPTKNIIPGQRVTKEKLQRAKELRHDMTPAEEIRLFRNLRGKSGTLSPRKTAAGLPRKILVNQRFYGRSYVGIS